MDDKMTAVEIDDCYEGPQEQYFGAVKKLNRISYPYQILLNLICFASQLSIELYSLLGVLSLQYFGLSLSMVSSLSLISGLLSLTIIPAIGAFSDRGPRPTIRKAKVQAFGLCILLVGYTLIASAAAMTSKGIVGEPEGGNDSQQLNESSVLCMFLRLEQGNASFGASNNTINIVNTTLPIDSPLALPSPSLQIRGITVAGVLGVIGLSCLSVSYDMTLSLTKGLVVECAPAQQKTQILNTSSLMGGFAACIMSCVGMVDLPHYLGKSFNTDGMALTLILVCSCFSVLSILMFGTSIRAALLLYYKSKRAKSDVSNGKVGLSGDNNTLSGEFECEHKTDNGASFISDTCTHEDRVYFKVQQSSTNGLQHNGANQTMEIDQRRNTRLCLVYPRNARFILTMFSAFLGMGSILTGAMYFSHTLTIEIYNGDPTAVPGTSTRDNYEEGIKMASVGFLISSAAYVPTALANTKLLKHIDHHLVFAFISVVLAASVLSYYLMKSVATFLIAMAAFGSFRCVGHVLPYANALKYAYPGNIKGSPRADNSTDKTPAGRVTSLVGAMLPLHLLVLAFMGPAMESVGSGWLPMLYMTGLSCLNAVINIIIKIL